MKHVLKNICIFSKIKTKLSLKTEVLFKNDNSLFTYKFKI